MKKYLAISAAFVAFSAQPLQITDLAHFDNVGLFSAADAGNGNGKGGGNAGGNGNGRSSGGATASNNGGHGNGNGNGHGSSGAVDTSDNSSDDMTTNTSAESLDTGKSVGQSKVKNLHASLGRLNSINRNINGIMKSKSPHMAEIRSYILNSVELTKAQAELESAQSALTTAEANYDAAVAAYDAAVAAYDAALADPNTASTADATAMNDALAAMQSAEAALTDAQNAVTMAEANVATYEALTSDAALTDALSSASNKGDITPEMLDWSKAVLGVGDQTGAIDAYMVKFQ